MKLSGFDMSSLKRLMAGLRPVAGSPADAAAVARRKRARARASSGGIEGVGYRALFNWKQRERLYRHLAVQIANDVTWSAALESFHTRVVRNGGQAVGRILVEVIRGVKDGKSLAASLAPWVPGDEAMMVGSGEQAGNLPAILEAVINAKSRVGKVKRSVIAAVATPFVYLIALYGLIWAIGVYFLPVIAESIPRGRIVGIGASLYALGDFATSPYSLLGFVALLLIGPLVGWVLPRWTGRSRVKAEKFFPFSFYRDISGYLWLLSFSTLLSAGQPDVKILSEQAKRGTPWLRERVVGIRRRMENGASLAAALYAVGYSFPSPDMIDDIASMSAFKDFPVRIAKTAEQWAEQLEWQTTARVKALGLVFDVLVYMVIGYVLMAINSMSEQLGSVQHF